MSNKAQIECFISVGEFSGDLLAAQLVNELQSQIPNIHFSGIVGKELLKVGVSQWINMDVLNVMGLFDVLKKAAEIKMIEKRVLAHIDRLEPKLAILVDYPGFHFRLAEQLRMRGIKVVQYIAPKLWAWGASRVFRLRRDFDLIMGIFPFEAEFFRSRGVSFEFVGCPHLQRLAKVKCIPEELGFTGTHPIVAMLPGSRESEVRRILPIMMIIKQNLAETNPNIQFCVPVAANLNYDNILSAIPKEQREGVVFVRERSLEIMKASHLAIVASGTATLECALLETPMVVLYKLDSISYFLAKRKVKIKWVSLVNIIMNREVVPEYLQNIDIDNVVRVLEELLDKNSERHLLMKKNFKLLKDELSDPNKMTTASACIKSIL
ncbi:MAG: lipid-A-disaccharide synthase [Oligoflexales bacterium]